jgi:hypothetical protein
MAVGPMHEFLEGAVRHSAKKLDFTADSRRACYEAQKQTHQTQAVETRGYDGGGCGARAVVFAIDRIGSRTVAGDWFIFALRWRRRDGHEGNQPNVEIEILTDKNILLHKITIDGGKEG